MERLPFTPRAGFQAACGASADVVADAAADGRPRLRGTLIRPAADDLSLLLRVHSAAGIPLAYGAAQILRGSNTFETTGLTFLGMEGYAHLSGTDARQVETRIWSRRAFVTGELLVA